MHVNILDKVYELHSPKDNYFGCDHYLSLDEVTTLSKSLGLVMVEKLIPDGLDCFEEEHSDKAVIFDVRSEDVIMIEE